MGAAGGVATRLVVRLLGEGHAVFGIDQRPWVGAPVEYYEGDLRLRSAERAFGAWRPDVVVHMDPAASPFADDDDRRGSLVEMTRTVFDYCKAHGVEHCVQVSRHTFYGAGSGLPLFRLEHEPASDTHGFPRLADVVAADTFATNVLWRVPELVTTVLRECYTLGPTGHGTLALYLRAKRVPVVLGFDPLIQLIHEEDAISALVRTIERRPRGVFNIAGPPPLPLSDVIREAGRIPVSIPEFAFAGLLGRFGLPPLDRGAISHLKFPIVVDSSAFRTCANFSFAHDVLGTIHAFRDAFPPSGQ